MAVKDYPISYDHATYTLTVKGNSESDDYDKMGYSEATAFDFDDIKDFALYIEKTVVDVEIVSGGTGYAVDDVITVSGGTGTACQLKVTSVSSGVITGVDIDVAGEYTSQPSNPVSVTGGSGNDDATFNLTFPSLCRADGYEFDFIIVFDIKESWGDETYFKDTNKQVLFTKENIDENDRIIDATSGTNFQLGEVVDANKKTSANGCSIFIKENVSYGGGIKVLGNGGIYSSKIQILSGNSLAACLTGCGSDLKVWNSQLCNGGFYQCESGMDVYNVNIENCLLPLYYTRGVFDKITITDCGSFARVRRETHAVNAKNVIGKKHRLFCLYLSAVWGNNIR